jgi:hypothetical protein
MLMTEVTESAAFKRCQVCDSGLLNRDKFTATTNAHADAATSAAASRSQIFTLWESDKLIFDNRRFTALSCYL